jgi:transcriptional regulator with GAF, ATPase, and Fis domain
MDEVLLQMVAACREFVGGKGEAGDVLTRIAHLGTAALDADMAGLTLNDGHGGPKTVIYTDGMVPEIDQAQYDADRGPCLDASRDRRVHIATGSEDDWQRWPEFLAEATSRGVHSSVSIPVIVGDEAIGALNFYSQVLGHFDSSTAQAGEAFAAQIAVIAAYCDKAELAGHLQTAMASRAVIEQAKGIVMATMGCTPDEAFDILRQQSQTENRKLRDLAAELVARQQRHTRS